MRSIASALAFVVLGAAGPAAAQEEARPFDAGQQVTLLIPAPLLTARSPLWFDSRSVLVVEIAGAPGALRIGDSDDWRSAGWPSMLPLEVRRSRTRGGITQVDLRSEREIVRLEFADGLDATRALREVVVEGPPSGPAARAALDHLYALLAGRWFDRETLALSHDTRLALVRLAHARGTRVAFSAAVYRDRRYLSLDLGSAAPILTALQPNAPARAAPLFNDDLLGAAREVWRVTGGVPGFEGIRLTVRLPHRQSAGAVATRDGDSIAWYAPRDLVGRFAADDITGQQLVDGSVVLVNGNRAQILLGAAR
ncbi:MAG: hypothetical protein HYU53_16535 [Acidobacteria bacterium]|nr:hypothetical protein [Acidobacteriota bacterium]